MTGLALDLTLAVRMLSKSPWLSIVAILTLALGIGLNATVFSIAKAFLFPEIPYRDVDRLVMVNQIGLTSGMPYIGVSYPDFLELREHWPEAESVAGCLYARGMTLVSDGGAEYARGIYATQNLFDVLGVAPALGSAFPPGVTEPTAVLSHEYWMNRFGGSRDILGKSVKIDGKPVTVVGVLPPGVSFLSAQVWLPLEGRPETVNRNERRFVTVARLRSGVNPGATQLPAIAARLAQANPESNADVGFHAVPLQTWLRGENVGLLLLLLGAVGAVLLIVCVNVSNLLLARALSRSREIGVRFALGAGRFQIVRHFLTESLLLSAAGGGLGVIGAFWAVEYAASVYPFGDSVAIRLDAGVLALTAGVSILSGVAAGVLPALIGTRTNLVTFLKDFDSNVTSKRGTLVNRGFIVGEVAVSVVLLVLAGLFLRGLMKFQAIDLGFDPRNLTLAWITLPETRYPDRLGTLGFASSLADRLASLPNVESVSAATWFEVGDMADSGPGFSVESTESVVVAPNDPVACLGIGPGYFRTMGIPVLTGRAFTGEDRAGGTGVAVVNEHFARAYWPGGDALGKRIKLGPANSNLPWLTIVGVIRDVRHPSRYELSVVPFDVYVPLDQLPTVSSVGVPRTFSFVMRSTPTTLADRGLIGQCVRLLDPELPISRLRTMEEALATEYFDRRALLSLFGVFALTAQGIAALGVFGLSAHFVVLRRRELGIRIALGARRSTILRLVLGQGLGLSFLGIVFGVIGARAVTGILSSQLLDLSAFDPLPFVFAPILLLLTVSLSGFVPALRAVRINPIEILRNE